MKKLIVLLVFAGSIVVSFLFSTEIYRFHMKTYYTVIKGQDYKSMMKKAEEMYKNNEYKKLHDFLKVIILIYRERPEAARLMGLNMIKRGDRKGGTELIVSSLNGGDIDKKIIRETVVELYRQKLYGDIVDVAGRKLHGDDYLVDFYYGVALFHLKFYNRAISALNRSAASDRGMFSPLLKSDLYYYLALSQEETGRLEEALKNLYKADQLSSPGNRTGEALVRIYRKLGDYRKAEKMLRRRKRLY